MTYEWKGENHLSETDRALLAVDNCFAVECKLIGRGWYQSIFDSAEYAVELGLYDWRMSNAQRQSD